jgi:hypothetical protein
MDNPQKSGVDGARTFLKSAVEAKKIRDELESFGQEDLARVVTIAKSLGYTFEAEDLKKALEENWGEDYRYVKRLCLSEPPGF